VGGAAEAETQSLLKQAQEAIGGCFSRARLMARGWKLALAAADRSLNLHGGVE
jgi:hypothetical protein